ncbi:hypothetical protein ACFQ36_08085 [Arthrobacter sp. GCM10027362]|uniref:hypothetical protein n=1 Tax=Arthrobacter sp. GCM10027362 TaxID=3273379 RepID=UPI0036422EB3
MATVGRPQAPLELSDEARETLTNVESANPDGDLAVITESLSSHNSLSTEAATALATAQLTARAQPWIRDGLPRRPVPCAAALSTL